MDRWLPIARLSVVLSGAALVAVGAGMWWLPAGFMVGGALLVVAGMLAEMRAR